jgi:hypothetical protein
MCRVAKAEGSTLKHYHQQRIHRFNDPSFPKGNTMTTPAKPTDRERITMLEAQAVTAKMQHQATLMSLTKMGEQIQVLTEVIAHLQYEHTSLAHRYREHLRHQAIQMVLDGLDDHTEPTWEDVQSIDEWLEGQPVKYSTEVPS